MISAGINLNNKKVLIIGGGCVARRKAQLFSEHGALVTIIAREIKKEIQAQECIAKEAEAEDCSGFFLVYAATDSKVFNHQIVKYCNEHNILVGNCHEDADATYHSPSFLEHDLGTISFLSKEPFPYMLPVLKEMNTVLDQHATKLQHMIHIRSLMKEKTHLKAYFDLLYDADENVVTFIDNALTLNKGYIYLHHNESDVQNIKVNLYPNIVLSIEALEGLKNLFKEIHCIYIPLVVSAGNILNKMNQLTGETLHPLIENDEELNQVLKVFEEENTVLCVYLHPRKHIAYSVYSNEQREFHLLTENVKFNVNKQYKVISFLMNHGNHYKAIEKHIREYNDYGFRIYNAGVLSDHQKIIRMLEEKNTK